MLSSAGESVLDSVNAQMPLSSGRWAITRELKALAFAVVDLFVIWWSCWLVLELPAVYSLEHVDLSGEQGSHDWLSTGSP